MGYFLLGVMILIVSFKYGYCLVAFIRNRFSD